MLEYPLVFVAGFAVGAAVVALAVLVLAHAERDYAGR